MNWLQPLDLLENRNSLDSISSFHCLQAAAAAEKNKSAEERDLEAKVEAQGKIVAALKQGKAEGDVEEAMTKAKEYKTELAELRKKLKEASIA